MVHQDQTWTLFIDVDASKQYSFAMIAYPVLGDPKPTMINSDIPEGYDDDSSSLTTWLKQVSDFDKATVEPILFLSKCLSSAERRYFPTELEMAGIC